MATLMKQSQIGPTAQSAERLAFVAYNSLGDSLLHIMIAENLQRNGYPVTLFGDVAYHLRDWLPQLEIFPYPAEAEMEAVLDRYPFVIMVPPSFFRKYLHGELLERLRQKWLLICQKAPKEWHVDVSKQNAVPIELCWQRFARLSRASASIRYRKFETESVVEITLDYLREQMGLSNVSSQVALRPPEGLQHRKFRHRIVVSPDSAWPEKKDWTPRRFMKLCRLLVARGYEPIIVVAPKNHQTWRGINSGRYLMPQFATITELAAFIYESGAVIANDSGNGHLASFLDVPVVTIYRKRNPMFHWRPAWRNGVVVCPKLVLPWVNGPVWRPFISPQSVVSALQSLLQDELPIVPRSRR